LGLIDNITITNNDILKGAAMIAYGNLASFPGELETVINPTTYTLNAGLTELGGTTEDGVTLTRTAEVGEGISVDQRLANLRKGDPEDWSMMAEMTFLETDTAKIAVLWQTPTPETVSGSVVTQKKLSFGAPATFTERQLYIIQEDPSTSRLRVFAFRKAVPQTDSGMNIQSNEASGAPTKFEFRQDTTQAEHHGPFGFQFEETL